MFSTKYRPQDFKSVLGLDVQKEILQNILRKQEYDPAYLFSGDWSTGKTTLARIFARSIFCQNRKEDMSPCNECFSCREFLAERHPGYIEIDAANNGTKDKIKEIRDSLSYDTVSGRLVILYDEAHNISKEGKDAWLKELEKEYENVHLIFCTTEIDKMPDSLRSRCMQFTINHPTEAHIKDKLRFISLQNNLNVEDDALSAIVQGVGCHYRDAENKLRQISFLGDISLENTKKVVNIYNEEVSKMLIALSVDINEVMAIADFLVSRMTIKEIYNNIIRMLIDSLRLINGLVTESSTYNAILTNVAKQYGESLYEVIDFILSKNRFNDLSLFQSDLLLIHYKYLRSQFDPKVAVVSPGQSNVPAADSSEKQKGNKMEDLKTVSSPWERAEIIRNLKKEKKDAGDSRVPEVVSSEWGLHVDKFGVGSILKKEITPEQFGKKVRGQLDENKI